MEGQLNLFTYNKVEFNEEFPCDNCIYDKCCCCNYPEKDDDYCVMGDKQVKIS